MKVNGQKKESTFTPDSFFINIQIITLNASKMTKKNVLLGISTGMDDILYTELERVQKSFFCSKGKTITFLRHIIKRS